MPLEFESEEEFEAAAGQMMDEHEPVLEGLAEPESDGPLVFDSEVEFQQAVNPVQQDVVSPQQSVVPQGPGLNPADLASAVLGNTVPEPQKPATIDRKTIIDSYAPVNNTLAQKMPEGVTEIHPADMEAVTDVLSKSFFSMSSTGILLDPAERVMYATSVMENSSMRADVRAQLIDQAMRDGKILPEALPKSWYEARGLLLLPPNINLDDLEGEVV